MTKSMVTDKEQVDITLSEIRKLRNYITFMLAFVLLLIFILVPSMMFLMSQQASNFIFLLDKQSRRIEAVSEKVDNNQRSTTVIITNLKTARDRASLRLDTLEGEEVE